MSGKTFPPMAERLLRLPVPVDLLVVDDNSPDGTGKLADELAARNIPPSTSCTARKNRAWAAPIAPASPGRSNRL